MSSYALIHRAIEPSKIAKRDLAGLQGELADGNYVLQPKYDGVNGVLDVGSDSKGWPFARLRTRTGEAVPSCQHIELAALELPPGRYFGEIWKVQTPHTKINGAARQHDPAPWLTFVAFDYLNPADVKCGRSELSYEDRFTLLGEILDEDGTICITEVLSCRLGTDLGALQQATPVLLAELRARGGAYDGLICRPTAYGLELGHSGNDGAIIKLKPRASADLLCVGTFAGKGKYAGMTGGLIVSLDGTPDGPTCEVGTGLDDKQRQGGILFAGKIVEVEYLELTAKGKLREPSFKSVRHDKQQADNLIGE